MSSLFTPDREWAIDMLRDLVARLKRGEDICYIEFSSHNPTYGVIWYEREPAPVSNIPVHSVSDTPREGDSDDDTVAQ